MENLKTKNEMPTPAMQGQMAAEVGVGAAAFVSAENDLVAKDGTHQDSWFIISNLESSRGTLPLLSHFLRITSPDGASFLQVMYSLLDPKTGIYLNDEQVYPAEICTFSKEKLEVLTPNGDFTGDASKMHLTGKFDGFAFDLDLVNPGLTLCNLGNGLMPMLGDINYHFALPSLETTGTVTIDGEEYKVTGPAWLDRQWGRTPRFFDPTGAMKWIWFAIVLDNGDRISVWDVNEPGIRRAWATIMHSNGGHEVVAVEPLENRASSYWTSPDTGHVYPTKFDLRMPAIDGSIQFETEVKAQEIISKIGAHKYEGNANVQGVIRGEEVTGTVVIELVKDWL